MLLLFVGDPRFYYIWYNLTLKECFQNKHEYVNIPGLNLDPGVGFIDRNFPYGLQRSQANIGADL
jgi:hypothetical protein